MRRSGSLGIWLGRQKEKEIFKYCIGHFAKIVETVRLMQQSVDAYNDEDVIRAKELANAASDMEKSADEMKKQIIDELVKGMFHPIDREEILRLVLEVDGIASNAKAAVSKLTMIPREMLSDSLMARLSEFAKKLMSTVQIMSKAFSALVEGDKNVFELSQEVESWEERIDDFRAGLIREEFLPWCQEPNRAGMCIILKEAMDNMEKVADQAEDVADVIRSIAILSG